MDYQNSIHIPISGRRHEGIEEKWQKPNRGWMKLNTDASIKTNTGCGMGGILRDHWGNMKNCVVKFDRFITDIDVGEATACLLGIKQARSDGYSHLEIEVDSQIIAGLIYREEIVCNEVGTVIFDICKELKNFEETKVVWINRRKNTCAHLLAYKKRCFPLVSHSFEQWCNILETSLYIDKFG